MLDAQFWSRQSQRKKSDVMPVNWATSTTASSSFVFTPTSTTTSSTSYAFAYGYGNEVRRVVYDEIDPNGKREEHGLTFDDLVDGAHEDVE